MANSNSKRVFELPCGPKLRLREQEEGSELEEAGWAGLWWVLSSGRILTAFCDVPTYPMPIPDFLTSLFSQMSSYSISVGGSVWEDEEEEEEWEL